jgi:hypothetical protein
MRTATFLFALLCVAVLVLADTTLFRQPSTAAPVTVVSRQQDQSSFGDSVRMWRRAEVQVVPLDLAIANRAELESLRRRAVKIEAEAVALNNPREARDQLDRRSQLIRALISLAERQGSDQGKSATAIAVQRHLNHIEGRIMCESCHTSVSAIKDASLKTR